MVQQIIKPNIQNMTAYNPPLEKRDPEQFLLLDFNERTIHVSNYVKKAMTDFIHNDHINNYPKYGDFMAKVAKYVGVKEDEVMFTNGSDQGIDIVFRATCKPGDEVIIPSPSFAMYYQSALIEDVKIHEPEYTFENGFPLNEILDLINEKTKLIVVCNPNNPTGTLVSSDDIIKIAKAAPQAAILVDECYFECSQTTVKNYINECTNIFITRTFSKTWGLASLRIGYLISNEKNIKELKKIRGPYDANQLSVVAASAALDEPTYMTEYIDEVMNTSMPMFIEFLEKQNIKYWPSAGNFILFEVDDCESVSKQMEDNSVLVRSRNGVNIDNTVRVTLGTKNDTERLIGVLEEVFNTKN